jgi:hypothetical protein
MDDREGVWRYGDIFFGGGIIDIILENGLCIISTNLFKINSKGGTVAI